MDIVNRLTLAAAKDPRSELACLGLEAAGHIESLRDEIALLRKERPVLPEQDRLKTEKLS